MQTVQKALVANPLRAIRHADGLHKRVMASKAGKGSYQRREKHRNRADW